MTLRSTPQSLILTVGLLLGLSACGHGGGSSEPSTKAKPVGAPSTDSSASPELEPPAESVNAPEGDLKTGPLRPEAYPASIVVELQETGAPVFGELVSIVFSRYGMVFSRNLYVFKKAYIGPVDDHAWLWWQLGDDVTFSTPWPVISVDLEAMKVFGGTKAGEGVYLGDVVYDGHKFSLEPRVKFSLDKEPQQISISEQPAAPQAPASACPQAVKMAGACSLYLGIYEAVAAIDFSALGEVGPGVAADVVNFGTVFKLATSVMLFKPGVDQIRSKYLVPALKSIHQLKALGTADPANHDAYLAQTRAAYANLIVTSLDTLLKTQKMMPEAIAGAGQTSLGVVLAYVGLNGAGDRVIAKGQPKWFRELIAPIIREFGVLTLDLILNETNTPLQRRIDRFIAMEDQIQDAIERICRSSPTTAQSDCSAAI